jgi:hypothetical protein
MKRTGVGLLALGMVLLLGTWAQAAPANLATLDVLVLDQTGTPLEGIPVRVQTERGDLVSVTDVTGTAVFDVKVPGNDPAHVVVTVLGGEDPGDPLELARGVEEEITILVPSLTPIWTIDEN